MHHNGSLHASMLVKQVLHHNGDRQHDLQGGVGVWGCDPLPVRCGRSQTGHQGQA